MKTELSKFNRIKRDENYKLINSINTTIKQRIESENNYELQILREENSNLVADEKEFYKEVANLLNSITTKDLVKVVTQVGEGSKILNEYVGHIQHNYKDGSVFNFISESRDNKPFTIGFSCLQSIEIINEENK